MSTSRKQEVLERFQQKFEAIQKMTDCVRTGDIRSLIISGPPGIGKTHGVRQVLERMHLIQTVSGLPAAHEIIQGSSSPVGLYQKLYRHSDPNHVIVFDDCDDIYADETSLNVLKSALDTTPVRTICWNKNSPVLAREGIPNRFDFFAGLILLTNIDFMGVKSPRLKAHLNALISRSHYIDLNVNSREDLLYLIENVVENGMLQNHGINESQQEEIMQYFASRTNQFRELSLRTVLKIASLYQTNEKHWQVLSDTTLCK